jgi:hypothetical protein
MVDLSTLQNPKYTGANRCWKCTGFNLLLTAIGASVLGFLNVLAGGLLAVLGIGSIYFRGYLIPGTPTLTKRYLPSDVLHWFGHSRADPGEAIETVLLEAGVLREGEQDHELDPDFEVAWRETVAAMRDEAPKKLIRTIGGFDESNVGSLTVDADDGPVIARADNLQFAQWDSRGTFLADAAAAKLLARRSIAWEDLSFDERAAVLAGLRLWLSWCPLCEGDVTVSQETVETCCDTVEVVRGDCEDCGRRLYELRADRRHFA